MPSIQQTALEAVQLVLPEHANVRGTLYGGRMMDWITQAATMAAMRVAVGPVVLGSMDDLDFLSPVHVGDVVTLRAQVEYIGTSSLEVGVEVWSERPAQRTRRMTTASHLAMVAVDDEARPRPVGAQITPAGDAEAAIYQAARARKAQRDRALQDRRQRAHDVEAVAGLTHAVEVSRLVFPDDAVLGTLMFAGRLMMVMDEVASILALRYCRGPVVTASIDALSFYAPIRVGEIITCLAGLNYVGRSSMEIGVKVIAEHPLSGSRRHTCTAFLTSVHVGPQGAQPVPPFTPQTPEERRRWEEAARRREIRQVRRARLARTG